MKNLKKVLALVLVVAMMASFATVSAAFPDADSISYSVAADALASLKVISGYGDGTFRPTNLVTRGHMAKMVAFVMNGGKDAAASYGSYANTAFDDVALDYTFANGIGYVVSKGIVSGYADGTFRAGNNVTGIAAAKMLLGALGYNATVEGYENNTQWKQNVIADGEDAKLFVGLETIDLNANLTREAAAQMIWNALNAKTVKYNSTGISITTPDGTVVNTGATAAETDYASAALKFFGAAITSGAGVAADGLRPTVEYKMGTKVLAVASATPVLTYTAPVKKADVAKALGCTGTKTVVVESVAIGTTAEGTYGANGVVTEIYALATDPVSYDIVTVEQSVETLDSDADIVAYKAGTLTTDEVKAHILLETNKPFYTDAFAKGDVVVYTKNAAGDEIMTAVKATPVAGVVTAYGTNYVRLDGVKYELADCAALTIGSGVLAAGAKTTMYLDSYGYVVAAIETPGAEQPKDVWHYGYVLDYASRAYAAAGTGDLLGEVAEKGAEAAEKIKLVDSTGAVVILDTNLKVTDENKDGKLETTTFVTTSAIKGEFVKYTLTDTGLVAKVVAEAEDLTATFNKGNAKIEGDTDLMTASTVVVFAYTDAKGNPVYESYTGYTNIPSFKDATAHAYSDKGAVVAVYVEGKYTAATPAKTPDTYAYFASAAVEAVYNAETKVTEYVYSDVYLDGVKGTLTFAAEQDVTNKLYTYTVDKGLATITVATTGAAEVSAVAATYVMAGDPIYVGANTKYFEITKTGVVAAAGVAAPTQTTTVSIVFAEGGATADAKDAAAVVYFTVAPKA